MSDTKTKPFPQQPGHPENFGFVKCSWCGTHRPEAQTIKSPSEGLRQCADGTWCTALVTRGAQ